MDQCPTFGTDATTTPRSESQGRTRERASAGFSRCSRTSPKRIASKRSGNSSWTDSSVCRENAVVDAAPPPARRPDPARFRRSPSPRTGAAPPLSRRSSNRRRGRRAPPSGCGRRGPPAPGRPSVRTGGDRRRSRPPPGVRPRPPRRPPGRAAGPAAGPAGTRAAPRTPMTGPPAPGIAGPADADSARAASSRRVGV